jgi:flagellar hook assembly protein FlgD
VSIIGTFQTATPPAAAVTALERLLAWKLDVHHVDPQSTATITCNYGQKFKTGERVKFHAIAGHRDANYTDCPGNKLYALLPAIRKAVAGMGTPKIYGLWASPDWISPNGDGSGDATSVKFTVSSAADWSLQIQDDAGKVLRTFSAHGTSASVSWGGTDSGGHVQPDGVYKIVASAHTASGEARTAATSIHIDRTPPRLTSLVATPETFSPNGDGHADTSTARFTAGETCSARVTILDASSAMVRKLSDWKPVPSSGGSARWDGRVTDGAGLTQGNDGVYRFRVELRDPAGNTGSGSVPVTVDRTLASPSAAPSVFSPNGDGVRDSSSLSFTLSRKASVALSISLNGRQVRRFSLGSLAPGRHAAEWDGKAGDGSAAASGFYRFVADASSTLGRSAASEPLTLDRTRPRLTVLPSVTAGAGKSMSLSVEANDQYSSKVNVGASVTDATGAVVASLDAGWLARGKASALKWKPPGRGQYTVTWRASDQGGNTLGGVISTQVTVR